MSKKLLKNTLLKSKNVLIIDDHFLQRMGLIAYLKKEYEGIKINFAESGRDFLDYLDAYKFDCVFIDAETELMNLEEMIGLIKLKSEKTKILFLTGKPDSALIAKLMELNIDAILERKCTSEAFKQAIQAVEINGVYIPNDYHSIYQEYKVGKFKAKYNRLVELSPKEVKVVSLMCQQMTSVQISFALGVSKSTIDTHRKRIFKKLNIDNSIGIVIYAIKHGIYSVN